LGPARQHLASKRLASETSSVHFCHLSKLGLIVITGLAARMSEAISTFNPRQSLRDTGQEPGGTDWVQAGHADIVPGDW
jgi:hypothetical protein